MERYLLVREAPDGTLQGVRFDRGIVSRMQITEDEWKALPTHDPLALRRYIAGERD